jgi:S1-C subfamily serine protease
MSSYAPLPPPYRRRRSFLGPVLIGILFGFLLFSVFPRLSERLSGLWSGRSGAPPVEPRPVAPRGDLAADEKATIELFARCSPSVVYITTLARRSYFFDVSEVPQGTGSGFIWDREGHVVTNFHVLQGADSARVTLADQSTWKASLVGTAPDKDLAVLRISAPTTKLPPILVGTSRDLQVGQKVFAIGDPFGLDQTLTTGVVSALGRSILSVTNRKIEGVVQTDAAINPGNSGGPLLDSAGRLIGVNTQIASPTGASAGIGFAVPVDTVNQVVPQLIQHGRVIRPQLGIVPAEDRVARRLGVNGVLVLGVAQGSGAEQAGLRGTRRDEEGQLVLGDIIEAIDDSPVKSFDDLLSALERHKIDDAVTVRLRRDGQPLSVKVSLQGP